MDHDIRIMSPNHPTPSQHNWFDSKLRGDDKLAESHDPFLVVIIVLEAG